MMGLGVAVPGPLDQDRAVVRYAANLGWVDYPLQEKLHRAFPGVAIAMDDDSRCAAWGEALHGAGHKLPIVWYTTVSTGIGSGLIIKGEPYRGAQMMAGELGHVTVDVAGPMCACGRRGCLEAIAAGPAMARDYSERRGLTGTALSAEDVFLAVRAGDLTARGVVAQAVRYLAMALSYVVHLVNPDILVLGGGIIIHQSDLLLPMLREEMRQHLLRVQDDSLTVRPALLGEQAGLWGAYELIARHVQKGGESDSPEGA
jgi:glucokinase